MTGTVRYVAFQRAINVGSHLVKMDRLRKLFEEMELADVSTFIASGNVVFRTDDTDADALERRIERHLEAALGYAVATFLRTEAELAEVAVAKPFPRAKAEAEGAILMAGFLHDAPPAARRRAVEALETPTDTLRVVGREVFWLRSVPMSETKITGALLEKTLGMPATLRNITTVRRLAAKLAGD